MKIKQEIIFSNNKLFKLEEIIDKFKKIKELYKDKKNLELEISSTYDGDMFYLKWIDDNFKIEDNIVYVNRSNEQVYFMGAIEFNDI